MKRFPVLVQIVLVYQTLSKCQVAACSTGSAQTQKNRDNRICQCWCAARPGRCGRYWVERSLGRCTSVADQIEDQQWATLNGETACAWNCPRVRPPSMQMALHLEADLDPGPLNCILVHSCRHTAIARHGQCVVFGSTVMPELCQQIQIIHLPILSLYFHLLSC